MINSEPNSNDPPDDYLPARMINEFAYCPRLFFLMHVEKQFADNYETTDGHFVHRRVDAGDGRLDAATYDGADGANSGGVTKGRERSGISRDGTQRTAHAEPLEKPRPTATMSLFDDPATPSVVPTVPGGAHTSQSTTGDSLIPDANANADTHCDPFAVSPSTIHARSVTLSSDALGVIAKMDLVERTGNSVTPVDYKRGRPKTESGGKLGAWLPEKIQICLQVLVLRENGYSCDQGVLYFNETRQRVAIEIDDALIAQTHSAVTQARQVAASGQIPPPLVASPKCPKCSMVGICLPDETRRFSDSTLSTDDVRPMITARDQRRPLYLNTQGLYVGKDGERLRIKEKNRVIEEVRLRDVNQINVHGSIQLTAQTVQTALQMGIPILYFSSKHWFYGMASGLGLQNVGLRQQQFRLADDPAFSLHLAQTLVRGKIQNCRTLLMRNHTQPSNQSLIELKRMARRAMETDSLASLLGIEGTAARVYFQSFAGMIKVGFSVSSGGALDDVRPAFDFRGRNRRPPRDPVNALLSLAYSLLTKDCTVACTAVGLDPHIGFYHQVRPGKPALALDLMEPFRPLIADSVVVSAINNRMVTADHFIAAGQSVTLTAAGRRHFFHAYEQRMDQLVTHPLLGYRVSYRRLLEIQTRLLGRCLMGEIESYPVFKTR
ncbi:MAG: CRISPR-associated endonuclease Cas1 [Pirellulaceae bacterium]